MKQTDIGKLRPYEFNNRNHCEEQIDRIARSIKEFGFNQPIVVDEDGVVLVGHGRLFAARKLGLEKVPVVVKDGLTEAQKKAYRILDNKLQNDSTWSFDNLELELGFLEDNGFELEPWGLDDLRGLFDPTEPEGADDDGPGAACVDTFIILGDTIELGPHRVTCQSCAECDALPQLADLWITDPPYGVAYIGKTKEALTIQNDDLGEEGTAALWRAATEYALANLKEGGGCYAAVPAGPPHFIFLREWIEREVYRQQLIWIKDSMVLGHSDYHYKHEPILYGWKPGASHNFVKDRTKTSVLEFDRPKSSQEHPTMKPIPLWRELIANSTRKGDVVLDTFLGSGTTLIACDQLGRICHGMEIEPKYCQVIIERYKKHCEKVGKPFVCKINGVEFDGSTRD